MGERRALAVEIGALGIGADQPIEIARLEFMGVAGERGNIADPVIAGAALDDGALAIGEALGDDMPGGVDAIVDIDDAPGALQALAIGAAIPGAAAVIDIDDGD